ncbi:LysE family translocator [Taklimakanibacter lacteus]|uniref:LysE family translocator n=1 Tax=Taklimakanibacter lacteus TaxID=2268456 RepID=UPI0013C4988D
MTTHDGWSVLPFTLALWVGEAVFFTIAVLGLAAFLHQFAYAFIVIKWLGVILLTYLACKMWFGRRAQDTDGQALPEATSPVNNNSRKNQDSLQANEPGFHHSGSDGYQPRETRQNALTRHSSADNPDGNPPGPDLPKK